MPIKTKLSISFLVIAFVSIFLVGGISFLKTKDILRKTTIESLHALSEFREGEIFLYLEKLKTRTEDFASDGFVRDHLEKINGRDPQGAALAQSLGKHLAENKKILDNDLLGIDVLDAGGRIVASTTPGRVGMDESPRGYLLRDTETTYAADIYQHEDGSVDLKIISPLTGRSDSSQFLGFLVNRFRTDIVDNMLSGQLVLELGAKSQITSMGKTDQTYLVNEGRMMISKPRLGRQAAFQHKVDTYPVRKCLQEGKEVKGQWLNYAHKAVVGASMCVEMGAFKWVLVSEQEEAEAFRPIFDLGRLVVIFGIVILIGVGIGAVYMARVIARPIVALHEGVEWVGQGNLDHKVGTDVNDEIGQLSRAFDTMLERLKSVMTSRDELDKEVKERLQIESALKESEEKFRNICAAAQDAIILMDGGGIVFYWNEAAENIFGYGAKEMIGEGFCSKVVPPHYNQTCCEEFKRFACGTVGVFVGKVLEVTGIRKSGAEFPMEISISSCQLHGTKHAIAIVRDVTARRRDSEKIVEQMRELERTNKDFQQFTGAAVGRELAMINLKKEVNRLSEELGKKPPYDLSVVDGRDDLDV